MQSIKVKLQQYVKDGRLTIGDAKKAFSIMKRFKESGVEASLDEILEENGFLLDDLALEEFGTITEEKKRTPVEKSAVSQKASTNKLIWPAVVGVLSLTIMIVLFWPSSGDSETLNDKSRDSVQELLRDESSASSLPKKIESVEHLPKMERPYFSSWTSEIKYISGDFVKGVKLDLNMKFLGVFQKNDQVKMTYSLSRDKNISASADLQPIGHQLLKVLFVAPDFLDDYLNENSTEVSIDLDIIISIKRDGYQPLVLKKERRWSFDLNFQKKVAVKKVGLAPFLKIPIGYQLDGFLITEDKQFLVTWSESESKVSLYKVASNTFVKNVVVASPRDIINRGDRLFVASYGKAEIVELSISKNLQVVKRYPLSVPTPRCLSAAQGPYFKNELIISVDEGRFVGYYHLSLETGYLGKLKHQRSYRRLEVDYRGEYGVFMDDPLMGSSKRHAVFRLEDLKKSLRDLPKIREDYGVKGFVRQYADGLPWVGYAGNVGVGIPPKEYYDKREGLVVPVINNKDYFRITKDVIYCSQWPAGRKDFSKVSVAKNDINKSLLQIINGDWRGEVFPSMAIEVKGDAYIYLVEPKSKSLYMANFFGYKKQEKIPENMGGIDEKKAILSKDISFKPFNLESQVSDFLVTDDLRYLIVSMETANAIKIFTTANHALVKQVYIDGPSDLLLRGKSLFIYSNNSGLFTQLDLSKNGIVKNQFKMMPCLTAHMSAANGPYFKGRIFLRYKELAPGPFKLLSFDIESELVEDFEHRELQSAFEVSYDGRFLWSGGRIYKMGSFLSKGYQGFGLKTISASSAYQIKDDDVWITPNAIRRDLMIKNIDLKTNGSIIPDLSSNYFYEFTKKSMRVITKDVAVDTVTVKGDVARGCHDSYHKDVYVRPIAFTKKNQLSLYVYNYNEKALFFSKSLSSFGREKKEVEKKSASNTAELLFTKLPIDFVATCVRMSHDGRHLYLGSMPLSKVIVWNVENSSVEKIIEVASPINISEAGDQLVVLEYGKSTLHFFRKSKGWSLDRKLELNVKPLHDLILSRAVHLKNVAIALARDSVYKINMTTGKVVELLKKHLDYFEFSAAGNYALVVDDNGYASSYTASKVLKGQWDKMKGSHGLPRSRAHQLKRNGLWYSYLNAALHSPFKLIVKGSESEYMIPDQSGLRFYKVQLNRMKTGLEIGAVSAYKSSGDYGMIKNYSVSSSIVLPHRWKFNLHARMNSCASLIKNKLHIFLYNSDSGLIVHAAEGLNPKPENQTVYTGRKTGDQYIAESYDISVEGDTEFSASEAYLIYKRINANGVNARLVAGEKFVRNYGIKGAEIEIISDEHKSGLAQEGQASWQTKLGEAGKYKVKVGIKVKGHRFVDTFNLVVISKEVAEKLGGQLEQISKLYHLDLPDRPSQYFVSSDDKQLAIVAMGHILVVDIETVLLKHKVPSLVSYESIDVRKDYLLCFRKKSIDYVDKGTGEILKSVSLPMGEFIDYEKVPNSNLTLVTAYRYSDSIGMYGVFLLDEVEGALKILNGLHGRHVDFSRDGRTLHVSLPFVNSRSAFYGHFFPKKKDQKKGFYASMMFSVQNNALRLKTAKYFDRSRIAYNPGSSFFSKGELIAYICKNKKQVNNNDPRDVEKVVNVTEWGKVDSLKAGIRLGVKSVHSLRFHPTHRLIAVEDGKVVKLFNTISRNEVKGFSALLPREILKIKHIVFTASGERLLIGYRDKKYKDKLVSVKVKDLLSAAIPRAVIEVNENQTMNDITTIKLEGKYRKILSAYPRTFKKPFQAEALPENLKHGNVFSKSMDIVTLTSSIGGVFLGDSGYFLTLQDGFKGFADKLEFLKTPKTMGEFRCGLVNTSLLGSLILIKVDSPHKVKLKGFRTSELKVGEKLAVVSFDKGYKAKIRVYIAPVTFSPLDSEGGQYFGIAGTSRNILRGGLVVDSFGNICGLVDRSRQNQRYRCYSVKYIKTFLNSLRIK